MIVPKRIFDVLLDALEPFAHQAKIIDANDADEGNGPEDDGLPFRFRGSLTAISIGDCRNAGKAIEEARAWTQGQAEAALKRAKEAGGMTLAEFDAEIDHADVLVRSAESLLGKAKTVRAAAIKSAGISGGPGDWTHASLAVWYRTPREALAAKLAQEEK